MRLLLDTHVLLWVLGDAARLTPAAARAIVDPDNEVYASAVNALEIAIKQSLGKLSLPAPASQWLPGALEQTSIEWLPISPEDAMAVGELPWHHRDPFDRLLVAQAASGYTLVTHDRQIEAYDIQVLRA
jgi:PIN domain nuclease of toxin-antitoxin system